MMNRLKKLIRWARISKGGSDDKQFPVQQVEYMGKVGDCMMIFPYGMHGNASEDSLVLMMTPNADSANRAGIPGTPHERPKMAINEFCLYHPKTQSIIHFRNNGDIDIDTSKNKSGNLNVNTTQANITASNSVNITAPDTNINGNLTVTGDTSLSATVTSNGKDISDTHTHPQGNDSDGDSQVNTGGVV